MTRSKVLIGLVTKTLSTTCAEKLRKLLSRSVLISIIHFRVFNIFPSLSTSVFHSPERPKAKSTSAPLVVSH